MFASRLVTPLAGAGVILVGAVVFMSRADSPSPEQAPRLVAHPIGDTSTVATFGSGCFWCTEAVFQDLAGVKRVVSGYSGGKAAHANYKSVLTGQTAHAEAVQVEFDPAVIDYPTLLEVFWRTHDPTTPNRQGVDEGPQYRSVIFFHDLAQQEAAVKYKTRLDDSGVFRAPIVTQIVQYQAFFPAEEYHQDYFSNNSQQPYCKTVIGPKLKKFRKVFGDKLKNAKRKSSATGSGNESLQELRRRLTPLQFKVTQQAATEREYANEYWDNKQEGDYHCIVCGELLFTSDQKFQSHCGWPSFTAPVKQGVLTKHEDYKLPYRRTEIRCSHCDAHLGHVFNDGPQQAGGLRYCMNSAAMDFEEEEGEGEKKEEGK